ncbi:MULTISPECIES: autotransporter domain-containing protein [unclassified Pseudomonas]|uniref:autotransporter outer membrane beta-barrel domain-containing protein n=1 Tax=unclassified Pseudomonas TaxID=196821 RepID=UPI00200C6BDE|nr:MULTISPECIES: autotransporter outer membrane beta-barrel domain-containing protein [unclassified Pseudomonas]
MSLQHKFNLQQLVLAVALAIGCSESTLAEPSAATLDPEVKTRKAKKNTDKTEPLDRALFADIEPIGHLELTPRPSPSSSEGMAPVIPASTSDISRVEFDDAFYEALEFPETPIQETTIAEADENPFDSFKNDWTTQHTLFSTALENVGGISLQMGEADDLVVMNNGARWDGLLDGGEGKNALLLNAVNGGEIGETRNFEGVRIARGNWRLSHDFNGSAEVKPGASLLNNGSIKEDAYVHQGAVYGGKGDVGNLYVDGTLLAMAGKSPVVRGNLELSPDAAVQFVVSADKGASPILVKGTASLNNATLNVSGLPGDYAQTSEYEILNAGSVKGVFSQVNNNLAFMTPTLSYHDTKVGLTYSRNDVPIEHLAASANGQALAKSVDTPKAISTNSAVNALLGSSKSDATNAIEQLAGGGNANLAGATLNSVSPVSASLLSAMHQLDGIRDNRTNSPRNAAGSADSGRVWLQALGHGGKLDSDVEPTRHSTKGLLLGADWRVDEQWSLGLMSGTSNTRIDSRELDGTLDSWHLGAYALRQNGPLSLKLGASWNNHDGKTKRDVAFNRFSNRLEGNYNANTQQVFAESGYNLGRENVRFEPFASLGYERYQRDAYTEKGGTAALKVQDQSQGNMNSTFGLRLAKVSTLDNGMRLTPRLSASWKHVYGDTQTDTRQRLVSGGRDYTVYGANLDRNSLKLDTGLDLAISSNHVLGLGLTGEIGTDSRHHGVSGQWQMAF